MSDFVLFAIVNGLVFEESLSIKQHETILLFSPISFVVLTCAVYWVLFVLLF